MVDVDLGVAARPGWEVATVLVTVKAYPTVGRKNGESVCVAGVRLDGPEPQWIRLFPVPFRALPPERQFSKYSVVQLRVRPRSGQDRRPESHQPDLDSMLVGPQLDTRGGWRRRWDLMEPLVGATTSCQLLAGARAANQAAPSLGLVRPAEARGVTVSPNPDFDPAVGRAFEQDLFGNELEVLQAHPFDVKLSYRCTATSGCLGGHNQSVVDWEAGQLGRRLLNEGCSTEEARTKVRNKYLDLLSDRRDVHLYLGNQHQHPTSFLVLGLWTPPAGSRPSARLF